MRMSGEGPGVGYGRSRECRRDGSGRFEKVAKRSETGRFRNAFVQLEKAWRMKRVCLRMPAEGLPPGMNQGTHGSTLFHAAAKRVGGEIEQMLQSDLQIAVSAQDVSA